MCGCLLIRCSPDGIGWQGVFFDHDQKGGHCTPWSAHDAATGTLTCQQHTCVNSKTGLPSATAPRAKSGAQKYSLLCKPPGITPFKGVCDKTDNKAFCDKSGAPAVCQKRQALHVNRMSRSAGILIVKRSSCDSRTGKCSIFKAGLCIDLRKNVWTSSLNDHSALVSISDAKGGMIKQATRFGRWAKRLLKKYKNKLPKKHRCSDHRHTFKYQRKASKQSKPRAVCLRYMKRGLCKTGNRYLGWMRANCPAQCKGWGCWTNGCAKTKDATLARFAILNF